MKNAPLATVLNAKLMPLNVLNASMDITCSQILSPKIIMVKLKLKLKSPLAKPARKIACLAIVKERSAKPARRVITYNLEDAKRPEKAASAMTLTTVSALNVPFHIDFPTDGALNVSQIMVVSLIAQANAKLETFSVI